MQKIMREIETERERERERLEESQTENKLTYGHQIDNLISQRTIPMFVPHLPTTPMC